MGQSTPLNPCRSRWYSAFKWMIFGNVLLLFSFFPFALFLSLCPASIARLACLVVGTVLALTPLACFVYGACRPTAYDTRPSSVAKAGIVIFWALTTIPALPFIAMLVTLPHFHVPPRTVRQISPQR